MGQYLDNVSLPTLNSFPSTQAGTYAYVLGWGFLVNIIFTSKTEEVDVLMLKTIQQPRHF